MSAWVVIYLTLLPFVFFAAGWWLREATMGVPVNLSSVTPTVPEARRKQAGKPQLRIYRPQEGG